MGSTLICAAFLLLSLAGCEQAPKSPAAPPPPVVKVAEVIQRDMPIASEWVGTTDGSVNAVIRAQVTGYIISQDYREGDFVQTGQVLFEIDPRTFEAARNEAQSQLARAEASWENAKANLRRIQPLAKANAIAQKDLDDAVALEATNRAAVMTAQAVLDKARVDLGFTRILSPIDGIAGIAEAQVGDLVGPGQGGQLTTVSQVDPIRVNFSISEQEYLDTMAGRRELPQTLLKLILANGRLYPHPGRFAFADRAVDVRTGTIKIAANFENPENILRPGQFVKVRAVIKNRKDALLIPQRAVMELQGSYQAAVVGPDNKVEIRRIAARETAGSLWIVEQGLKPGERVVAEGQQKVRPGMTVNPEPFEMPLTVGSEDAPIAEDRPVSEKR